MVRNDAIDLGQWLRAIQPSQLLMPLDTHVLQVSKGLGLLDEKTTRWQTAETLTTLLKQACPADPVKYDIALFGNGVDGERRPARDKKNRVIAARLK